VRELFDVKIFATNCFVAEKFVGQLCEAQSSVCVDIVRHTSLTVSLRCIRHCCRRSCWQNVVVCLLIGR